VVGYPAATSAVLLTVHVALVFILNEGVTPWLAIYRIMGHHNLKRTKHPKIMACINDTNMLQLNSVSPATDNTHEA
jgi:hypothetical protein